MDTMRSNGPGSPWSAGSNVVTSAVITVRLVSPLASASASMNWRWVRELETVTISLSGQRSAAHRQNEPHPQPSSRTRWPSVSPARSP